MYPRATLGARCEALCGLLWLLWLLYKPHMHALKSPLSEAGGAEGAFVCMYVWFVRGGGR